MRIIKAKWHNHPILGNLELNFTKNGNPCSTIVLAGENGTGKTAILTSLFKFCNFETAEGLEEVEMETPRGIAVITAKNDSSDTHTEYIATFADGTTEDWKASRDSIVYKKFIGSNPNDPRNNGCSMSKAEAIYNVTEVKNISAKELDSQTIEKNKDNFSPQNLKELFVDIAHQDYTDYSKRGEQDPNNPNTYAAFDATSRISRFKNAFNDFFAGGIQFKNVDIIDGSHEVIFEKNGKKILIGELSTGESQIVFRGGELLSNLKNIISGNIFIDEPEISMHPSWQKKILSYYKNLFTLSGQLTAQMIIATHSESVIAEALKDDTYTSVLVLRKDPVGNVVIAENVQPRVLPTVTAGEINYIAFDEISTDYHIALYAYIQEICGRDMEYNHVTVSNADSWISTRQEYNSTLHEKPETFSYTDNHGRNHVINYTTLPTYIRNKIDHPDLANPNPYTEAELRQSVDLMRSIIQNHAQV